MSYDWHDEWPESNELDWQEGEPPRAQPRRIEPTRPAPAQFSWGVVDTLTAALLIGLAVAAVGVVALLILVLAGL